VIDGTKVWVAVGTVVAVEVRVGLMVGVEEGSGLGCTVTVAEGAREGPTRVEVAAILSSCVVGLSSGKEISLVVGVDGLQDTKTARRMIVKIIPAIHFN